MTIPLSRPGIIAGCRRAAKLVAERCAPLKAVTVDLGRLTEELRVGPNQVDGSPSLEVRPRAAQPWTGRTQGIGTEQADLIQQTWPARFGAAHGPEQATVIIESISGRIHLIETTAIRGSTPAR